MAASRRWTGVSKQGRSRAHALYKLEVGTGKVGRPSNFGCIKAIVCRATLQSLRWQPGGAGAVMRRESLYTPPRHVGQAPTQHGSVYALAYCPLSTYVTQSVSGIFLGRPRHCTSEFHLGDVSRPPVFINFFSQI